VDPDSEIAQEEIFGPVLVVLAYDDDDDAVRIANNPATDCPGMLGRIGRAPSPAGSAPEA
jgi:acyl-CoA reductase-like NAD-dependent aldehyde dehydrogenase